jgi:hypothetical protein
MCERKEQLVAFIYDELEGSEGRGFEAHLRACAECRAELEDLRDTRGMLTSWAPPEPDFGFRIVRGAAAPPPAGRFHIPSAWGLAAAAVLVMAVGAAIANIEVRYGGDGLVVRTGWNRGAGAAPAGDGIGGSDVLQVDWKAEAAALDRRLRQLERSTATQSPVQMAVAPGISDADVLRRVREMVGQSETRQQRELARQLGQLTRDFETQRRLDLASIDQGMTRLQNTSGAEVKQYRDLIQRMYRATSYQQNALQLQAK